jgi:hypothetical protein
MSSIFISQNSLLDFANTAVCAFVFSEVGSLYEKIGYKILDQKGHFFIPVVGLQVTYLLARHVTEDTSIAFIACAAKIGDLAGLRFQTIGAALLGKAIFLGCSASL